MTTGAGELVLQTGETRFVVDCKVNPTALVGHVKMTFVPEGMIVSLKGNLWQSYGGLDTLFSYGANYAQDWISAIPHPHWAFSERTIRSYETEAHILVHA